MNEHLVGTVLFDGDCGICTASAEWIGRQDREGRLRVIPYQWADLDSLSPGLTPQMSARSVYFVLPDGRRFKEARAGFEILKRLPRWKALGLLLANPFFAALGFPFYRLVADNRTQISIRLGMTACAIPRNPAAVKDGAASEG
jgi:acetyl esterase